MVTERTQPEARLSTNRDYFFDNNEFIGGYMWRMIIPFLFLFFLACPDNRERPQERTKTSLTFIETADFTLPTLDGGNISLGDFKGKVIILDFWATWCGPCRIEMPGFVELQKEYREKGVQIIGVSFDRGNIKKVIGFREDYNINYPILMDDGSVARKYGVSAIPTTYVIDREGNLFKKYVGSREKNVFKNDIEELLR